MPKLRPRPGLMPRSRRKVWETSSSRACTTRSSPDPSETPSSRSRSNRSSGRSRFSAVANASIRAPISRVACRSSAGCQPPLSKQIDDLEPTLTRHGYTVKVLTETEMLGTKPGEIKALFKQTLDYDRTRELKEQMLAAGLPV